VNWRILLTAAYGGALGALLTYENLHPEMPDALLIAGSLLAPAIGFVVGQWWVVLAVIGAVVGRAIGWDPAENDGNPAFWPPYVISSVILLGVPLLVGVAVYRAFFEEK
jgi:hypothetical protein